MKSIVHQNVYIIFSLFKIVIYIYIYMYIHVIKPRGFSSKQRGVIFRRGLDLEISEFLGDKLIAKPTDFTKHEKDQP